MPHILLPSSRWTLDPRADSAFRHWGAETVAHHRLGNDTHRLAEPAGWILDRLAGGAALTADEIALGSSYDPIDLEPALQDLARIGYLVPC